LRDRKFAQAFIQAAFEDGFLLQGVLEKVIRAYGVKEFAAKIKVPSSNVVRAINSKHIATLETMNQLLKFFDLSAGASAEKK